MLQINLSKIANGTMSRKEIREILFSNIIDPFEALEALAVLRELKKAAEDVEKMVLYTEGDKAYTIADIAVHDALKVLSEEAENDDIIAEGGQFEYEGRTFKLNIRKEYDFSDASLFKGPHAVAWRKHMATIEQCKADMSLAKTNLSTAVKNYLQDPSVKHDPKLLKPAEVKMSISVM